MSMISVSDVMTTDVYAFARDTSIQSAVRVLTNRHLTGAPVLSESGQPVGVVTMGDLLDPDRERSFVNGYPLFYRVADSHLEELTDGVVTLQGLVSDVMSPFVLSIQSSAHLVEAANRMIAEQVHRLLVMDDARLVGIVTSIDLLRGFVMQLRK